MGKLPAIIGKELTLLVRDKAGLAVLFLMPAVLVFVITLVHQNVMKLMGESETKILILDQDKGDSAEKLASLLEQSGTIAVTLRQRDHDNQNLSLSQNRNRGLSRDEAIRLVADRRYEACVVVGPAFTKNLDREAADSARRGFDPQTQTMAQTAAQTAAQATSSASGATTELDIFFDPTVLPGSRKAISGALRMALTGLETEKRIQALLALLPAKLHEKLAAQFGDLAPDATDMPKLDYHWNNERSVTINEQAASHQGLAQLPSPIQQNVPAWTLFGIFFIAVPLAGSLFKERRDGTFARMLTMPVSPATLILGKLVAFFLVCCCQIIVIVLIGKYPLPWLGTDELILGPHYARMALMSLGAILAATGYGIFLGATCRTFEQITTLGPISIVVAAAIGGIMVPVNAMPRFMHKVSLISPMNWAQQGYLDILVRHSDATALIPHLALLFVFALATFGVGVFLLVRRTRCGSCK